MPLQNSSCPPELHLLSLQIKPGDGNWRDEKRRGSLRQRCGEHRTAQKPAHPRSPWGQAIRVRAEGTPSGQSRDWARDCRM